ncbi:hypothetical protein MPLA_2130117 [Mesorhizobium sp. ORS 3359]|nr:hypothetical protein MPLA_2130117 [Mesorhizobium sp. ORS 3359]
MISVMNELNVRRLIQVSTASHRDPEDGFGLKSKALVALFKVIARSSYDEIKATGRIGRRLRPRLECEVHSSRTVPPRVSGWFPREGRSSA